jgi:raffinose/stachyose/melibiose transport system permease protein
MKKIAFGKIFFISFAFIWLILTLFPLYFTVISSLKADNDIFGNMFALPSEFLFSNYIIAYNAASIGRAIFNSVFLSIMSITLMMVCVVMAAYVIARRKVRGSNILRLYFLTALMIPLHGALIPIVQMVSVFKGQNNFWVMIVIYSGLNLSLAFFLMTGFISGIDREIDTAAAIDGCGMLQTVFKIIVPISKPGIASASIVAFLNIYNELALANVLLTKKEYRTISVALLAFKGDYETKLGLIFASIVITIIPIMVFYLLAQEKVEKGLTAGAVKG